MNNSVAAIVVTFNRAAQLLTCLESILEQKILPDILYIIDNHSSKETIEVLFSEGFISDLPLEETQESQLLNSSVLTKTFSHESLPITYIRKPKNTGGAGGFYTGMKKAYEDGFQWLWLMDDDGIPDSNQLALLLQYSLSNNLLFSNALVTAISDSSELAFKIADYNKTNEIKQMPVIRNIVAAFNGTLISRKVIQSIGFIKKEMFIWGDEIEYTFRAKKNGFEVGTVTTAIHRHPKIKGFKVNVLPFVKKYRIFLKPKALSHYYYRNLGYNTKTYATFKAVMALYVMYTLYFIRTGHLRECYKFLFYFTAGMKNNFKS